MNYKYESFDEIIRTFSTSKGTLGLERLQLFLRELGNPESDYIALQVAGTNGKGSICTLLQDSLSRSGIKSGLTISPHLLEWEERIRIQDRLIPAQHLRELLLEIGPLSKKFSLTPFELITAAAFVYFSRQRVNIAVLEVGLGGRLDATSIHPHRQILGFASIGEDHHEFLGPDLISIAREKAAILNPGAIAISAPQRKEVAQVLENEAIRVGAELRWVKPLDWPSSLGGKIQSYNSAVVLGMIEAMAPLGWYLSKGIIQSAFQNADWPSRYQIINWEGHKILVDGAHNPPAARALRSEVDSYGKASIFWIIGVLANKNAPEMIEALLCPLDQAWIVPVPNHISWDSDSLSAACNKNKDQIKSANNLYTALDLVCDKIANRDKVYPPIIVVTGSLYLASTLLKDPIAKKTLKHNDES
uniref:Putative bifunctional Dihydrofolate/Folylpolyglutamate synthase n=1 Tax=Paulinella longichromatophora TaxID=1708747 RepID=A0A2H4ZP05_9EUKA|nr:putative bifunctional Dihydrofolate/Folylpolyglutamate synthase [Paulinella longichromatophora]